jgi:hypothetical protein
MVYSSYKSLFYVKKRRFNITGKMGNEYPKMRLTAGGCLPKFSGSHIFFRHSREGGNPKESFEDVWGHDKSFPRRRESRTPSGRGKL